MENNSGAAPQGPEHPAPPAAAPKSQSVPAIVGLDGLSDEERQGLDRATIRSVDEFWAWIGRDSSSGIAALAEETGIASARISEIAARQALRESRNETLSKKRRAWRCLKRHWADIAALAGIGVILVLFSRAAGLLDCFSEPIGLPNSAVVSLKRLPRGSVINASDLSKTRLLSGSDQFTEPGQLTGLIAAKDVPAGTPLRFQQVSRLQLVASEDLNPGDTITNDVIGLAVSTYEPDATTDRGQLNGSKVTRAFKVGDPVMLRFVAK